MRKFLFASLIAAIAAVMTSCSDKTPEATPVIDNVYTFKATQSDGTPGVTLQLKNEDGQFSQIDDFVYAGVKVEAGVILAVRSDGTFDLYKLNGDRLRFETSFKTFMVDGDFIWLTSDEDKPILYAPKKGYIFGPFDDLHLFGDKVVFKGLHAYGMYDLDYNYLIEAKYDRIYIVNKKDDKKYDVLLCKDNEWTLQDQDNADYPPAKTKKVLNLFMKKFKPDAPVGEFPLKY